MVSGELQRKEPEQAPDSPVFPAGRLQQDSLQSGPGFQEIFSSTTGEILRNDGPEKEGAVNLGPDIDPGLPDREGEPEHLPPGEEPAPKQPPMVKVPAADPESTTPPQVTGYV